jgi:hypothetical protein
MAIGKASDFKIYDEQFWGGATEVLAQNTALFNGASGGAIQLVTRRMMGNYEKESFLKSVSGLVSRRDPTSVAAATDLALTQGEYIGVKINRKIGPVAQTLDAFRKISSDPQEFSFLLGRQWGQAISVDYVNSAVGSVAAALANVAALTNDVTGLATKTVTHSSLVGTMAKMGDASSRVICFVMHSKAFFDLMNQSIADNVYQIGGTTIYGGTVATFNRPVIVTDSAALVVSGTPNTYRTLALVEGGVEVSESEQREIISQPVTGLESLVLRIQGEYAYNLKLKGMAWDTSTGGVNPTDAALLVAGNWDAVYTDVKDGPGAVLVSQ